MLWKILCAQNLLRLGQVKGKWQRRRNQTKLRKPSGGEDSKVTPGVGESERDTV